jgi:molybdopterin molybdotransferase
MDGYAIRAADTAAGPVSLALVGAAAAGSPAGRGVDAGEAIAIATGGVVPDGADAVVPVELARKQDGRVEIAAAVEAGANVRAQGGDVEAGSVVLGPGARLGTAQVGALAAAGVGEMRCAKRPRVGVLVTGSELRPPGQPLGPGEIYESNGLMLAAQLVSAGAVPAQLGVVADDEETHRQAMERALLGFDVLITTGGASVGPHDLVRRVQAGLRVEEVFWGLAIKPGKPAAFGVRRDHLVFNLPGNPVSALVCFEVLVRPAVNALLGVPDPLPAYAAGVLARTTARNASRDEFVRARVERTGDGVRLNPVAGQESHMIVSAAQADALVFVPRGDGELEAGEVVRYLPLT